MGEKTTGFGQDSEALAREENQRAKRGLEAICSWCQQEEGGF